MGRIKQMNIENRTYYFYDDMINIKPELVENRPKVIEKHWYLSHLIHYKIDSVILLYLLVHRIDGFIEEREGSKYLSIASTDSNSGFFKKYAEVCCGIKDQIEKINSSKSSEYEKNYMKIKFNSNNDLPFNKQLKFLNLTIIVRNVIEEDGKYYPQTFLDECLYYEL